MLLTNLPDTVQHVTCLCSLSNICEGEEEEGEGGGRGRGRREREREGEEEEGEGGRRPKEVHMKDIDGGNFK